MCGIAGILDHGGAGGGDCGVAVQAMLDKMSHRGPDANAVYRDGSVSLGHARLSIIDLSTSANQPFFDSSGRYAIVFNGEIYNFRELRSQIKDHQFLTNGDTEVLIEGFVRFGTAFFGRMKGMFAFAIWDNLEQKLLLCRDRMGVKPLYYGHGAGYLVFASELRAILASGFVRTKVSRPAIVDYLKYQSASTYRCIIEGVDEVLPGECIEIGQMGSRKFNFWSISDKADHGDLSIEAVKGTVRKLFTEAVERRLVADVPVGAFLSGGIDSSAVVAVMSQLMPTRPITFNISFSEGEFDESSYARLIADKYNTDHHEILIREESFLEGLLPALNAMDSPTGDGVNTYVVSKAVKEKGLTVALSGVGGDELFAGYRHFKTYHWIKRLGPFWRSTGVLRRGLMHIVGDTSKLGSLLATKSDGIEDIYPVLRQVSSGQMLKLLTNMANDEDPIQHELLRRKHDMGRFGSLSQYSIAEYLGYTLQTLLKDADQMSMAVSLELREPFFDHDLVRYVLSLPDALKYPHTPKQLFVQAMGDLLPGEIVNRRKQGFAFPWPVWMRGRLNQFCREHLDRMCERDLVQPSALRSRWKRFMDGDKSVSWMELWLFVTLEYWMEKNGVS